ncbi:MAG TPA: hypothetical protein PK339_00565 [Flavitalea sp.]|nr:hypothetical protein [Flavitalea sp.]
MKRFLRSLGLMLLYITATNNLSFSRSPFAVPDPFVAQPQASFREPASQISGGSAGLTVKIAAATFDSGNSFARRIPLSELSQRPPFQTSADPGPGNPLLASDTAIIMTSLNVNGEETESDAGAGYKNVSYATPAAKSCACEVLQVNSKNQRNLRIAVLVEKTSIISESDRTLVKQLLEKEKRYMKYFFYEEMKTLGNMIAPTDCQTLYKKLHSAANELQLYQVLDADIRQQL